jgi:hypothetical protein
VSTPLRERPDAPLGTLIFRAGLLPAETIESALEEGVKTGKRLGEILTERGLISEVDLARLLAGQKGLEFVTLREQIVDPTAAALFTEEQSRLFRALPYSFDGELPIVAIADPTDDVLIRNIREALGREDARFVVTARGELAEISADVYANSPQPAPPTAPSPPAEAAQANGHAEVVLEPSVAAEPEAAAPEPEPVAPEPEAVAADSLAVEPEPVASEPELSEPVMAEPEHAEPEYLEQAEPALPEPTVASEPPFVAEQQAAPVAPEAEAPVEPQAVEEPVPAQPPASPEAPVQPEPASDPGPPAEPEPLRVAEPSAALEPAATEAPVAAGPEAAAAEPVPFPQPAPPVPEPPYPPAAAQPAPEPIPAPVVEPVAAPPPPAEQGPAGTPWRMTIRLTNGERVEAGEFADEASAKQEAKTIMMQIAAADTDDWPFVNGRFLKPDTIVSVDIAESDANDG